MAIAPPSECRANSAASGTDENRPVRVLFVEDNPADALFLQMMLDERYPKRYETTVAGSLADALSLLAEQEFEAVLLDLSLPDSEGLETIAKVTTLAPRFPVVVLTGGDDEAVAMEAVRYGSQDYLIKGQVDGAGIARAIRYACDRKRTEEALRLTQFTVDRAVDAIFWITPGGGFTYVNFTACERLGYTRDELLTMNICDIDPNLSSKSWIQHWDEWRQRGSFIFESEHLAKDGRRIPVEITVNYLGFGGKEYCCASARDITDRKRAEESLRRAQQWLLEQEQRQRFSKSY